MRKNALRMLFGILIMIAVFFGWIVMLSAGFRNELQFSTGLEYQIDLNNKKVSEGLRQEFEKNRLSLSRNIAVSVKRKGSNWLITDKDSKTTYFVRGDKDRLDIYMNVILERVKGWEPSEVSRFNPLRYGFQILLVGTRALVFLSRLKYGFQIFLVAALALVFLSRRRTFNERLSLGIIIFGMFSLCQPFTIVLYRCGFQTLLVGTLAFIIVSHMKVGVQGIERRA